MKLNRTGQIIKDIVFFGIIIATIFGISQMYSKYNYNDFAKNVTEQEKTVFTRDAEVKYSKMDSYKMENIEYHDAMFSQTVEVRQNTPYKVTCKVKVENVENEGATELGGAHISINGTTERSNTVTGTADWQELTLLFNSKNRTKVNIGFRLGGYAENSKGTAWFSDFKMEAGVANKDKNWKIACFIFPSIDVDVKVNGKTEHVSLQMSENDIRDIKTNLERYKASVPEISHYQMSIEYDAFTIEEPIHTLSYDEDNGYYVAASDVQEQIDEYVQKNEYDHIYVAFRMADKQKGNNILVNDWIGLGGMDYMGIGFSNIRMPDDKNNYAYQYHYLVNTFPEEVFLHEFLHTLERNSKEYGYEIPALHDNAKYNYSEDRVQGLKKWYEDYMNCNISSNGEKIGLPAEIYTYKPVHQSDFTYSTEIDAFHEPENIIEVLNSLFRRIGDLFASNDDNMVTE